MRALLCCFLCRDFIFLFGLVPEEDDGVLFFFFIMHCFGGPFLEVCFCVICQPAHIYVGKFLMLVVMCTILMA